MGKHVSDTLILGSWELTVTKTQHNGDSFQAKPVVDKQEKQFRFMDGW